MSDEREDGLRDAELAEMRWYMHSLDLLNKVKKLHSKETRYTVYGFEEQSWESMEDLTEWFGEDEMPKPNEISTFDVCAECARAEWINSDFNYIGDNSAWPCPTARIWEGSE